MASNYNNSVSNSSTPRSLSCDSGVITINSESPHGSSKFEDVNSPLSPSSSFSVSSLGGIEHSFVDALLLCQWDNILGPHLEHVWYISGRPEPHTNILRLVTSQVLGGEICRDINSSQVDFKFFDIPDKGIIIPAFVFSAKGNTSLSLHSLALVIPNSELNIYLHQADLVYSWFMRIVSKLRIISVKKDFSTSGLADLSSWLSTCLEMLSSLQIIGLPLKIEFSYTAFYPTNTVELDFLRQAIASHLMTYNRSVIIGKNADKVNILVYTLGLFCWDHERLCSRAALSGQIWPYFNELCVQGIVKNKDGSVDMPLRELLCSQYPTTIIDADSRNVTQSTSVAAHRRLRHENLIQELEELYQGQEGFKIGPSGTFQPTNVPDSIVKQLIDDIHKLSPENAIRETFVQHFMHTLQRKAFCLIKYLEGESTSGIQGPSFVRVNTKRLRQDLNLQLEGDFRIVLATADKLRPGLYQFVCGERKYDNEYLSDSS